MTNNKTEELVHNFLGEFTTGVEEFDKIEVDVHELYQFDRDYEHQGLCKSAFTLSLFNTLENADVINFQKLASVYPLQAYIVAYKTLPQYLQFFTTVNVNGKEVEWKSDLSF